MWEKEKHRSDINTQINKQTSYHTQINIYNNPGHKESICVKNNGLKQFIQNFIYFGQSKRFWESKLVQI